MRPILILFLFLGFLCQAQTQNLLKIIDSDLTIQNKQHSIDSLLAADEKTLSPKDLADLYHNMGSKWYYQKWLDNGTESDISNAIAYTQKAVKIKRNIDALHIDSLGQTLYNLGFFQSMNDDFFQAIETNLKLADLGKTGDFYLDANQQLSMLYLTIGDFYKALNRFNELLFLYRKKDKLNQEELLRFADLNLLIAETYAEMGYKENSNEIKTNLIRADSTLSKIKEVPLVYRSSIDHTEGNRLAEIGNHLEAAERFRKVLVNAQFLDAENLSKVYNGLALSEIQLKMYDSALFNLSKAISLDPDYSLPYESLGDLYLAQNKYETGLTSYQKAIVYAIDKTRAVDYEDLFSLKDLELATEKTKLLNHVISKANGWLRYYHHDNNKSHLVQALETFALADRLTDIIRSESTEYQSKLFWREKGASLYMNAVEVCYLLDRPEDAYYYLERNKALLLLEDVSNEKAKDIAQLPDSVAKKEFDLKRAIFLSENELQLNSSKSSDEIEILREKVYANKRHYDQFNKALSIAFPKYANLKKKADILPYTDFKRTYASNEEVVLQYILNDEQGYGLLSSTERTIFFKIDDPHLLNEKIISLYKKLTDFVASKKKIADYNRLSHEVFNALIPERVYQSIRGKKVTIVTDYILQQLPFEALVVNVDKNNYLIEEVETRYAYSMSYLDIKKNVIHNTENELLGIAPIQFSNVGLQKLAFSGAEVTEVEKIYPGNSLLNGKATKSALLSALENYKIIHFSTHADVGQNGNPWIAFSDKKLFLNEIYATKNQADMVVLSACNTSLGELKKGEGSMSLARGFFHSGAKSVVASLWTINDKASKDLMVAFYKGLNEGLTKAAALRKAKINYIDTYRGTMISPSFWAALIVIGDNTPLVPNKAPTIPWFWPVIVMLILGFVFFLFYNHRKANLIQKEVQ
ncbi:CHAT domain-containing protein [uncultured Kriegella sp.]|uniref:CHAT domain-containing protein n=1 Tax=uncultured Kriegella sp. TaxID=1798910 RepID=UPI0030DDA847|tara:strand:- start:51326 stop:54097 length:2772 start_codon:yes stop_codon:yes gene_type:complete